MIFIKERKRYMSQTLLRKKRILFLFVALYFIVLLILAGVSPEKPGSGKMLSSPLSKCTFINANPQKAHILNNCPVGSCYTAPSQPSFIGLGLLLLLVLSLIKIRTAYQYARLQKASFFSIHRRILTSPLGVLAPPISLS